MAVLKELALVGFVVFSFWVYTLMAVQGASVIGGNSISCQVISGLCKNDSGA